MYPFIIFWNLQSMYNYISKFSFSSVTITTSWCCCRVISWFTHKVYLLRFMHHQYHSLTCLRQEVLHELMSIKNLANVFCLLFVFGLKCHSTVLRTLHSFECSSTKNSRIAFYILANDQCYTKSGILLYRALLSLIHKSSRVNSRAHDLLPIEVMLTGSR